MTPALTEVSNASQATAGEQEALADLILAAQNGAPEAVHKFLEVVLPAVRRTCRSVLGDTHPDLEDCVQESLLASVKALPKYRFDSDVRRYVATIALRLAINTRRRGLERWHRHRQTNEHRQHGLPAGVPGDALLDGLGLVRRILDDLNTLQSEAMFMRVILGFTVEEIAVMKGVAPSTVKTRLRRGKEFLSRTSKKASVWRRVFSNNR